MVKRRRREEEEEDHSLTVVHSMEVQNLIIQESQSFTIGTGTVFRLNLSTKD